MHCMRFFAPLLLGATALLLYGYRGIDWTFIILLSCNWKLYFDNLIIGYALSSSPHILWTTAAAAVATLVSLVVKYANEVHNLLRLLLVDDDDDERIRITDRQCKSWRSGIEQICAFIGFSASVNWSALTITIHCGCCIIQRIEAATTAAGRRGLIPCSVVVDSFSPQVVVEDQFIICIEASSLSSTTPIFCSHSITNRQQ